MKQSNYKASDYMRKRAGELSKLNFKNRTEFLNKLNKNKVFTNKNLRITKAVQKHKA
jgi:hypothetical protein